jgi:hypothetical protein
MILSGLAVHMNAFGSALVSATSIDGRLEIDDGAEDPTFESTSAELGENEERPNGIRENTNS